MIAQLEQRMRLRDEDYQELERDVAEVETLRQYAQSTQDPNSRFQYFEQIRTLSARYGVSCGPTDINCQLAGLGQLLASERQLRQQRDVYNRRNCL